MEKKTCLKPPTSGSQVASSSHSYGHLLVTTVYFYGIIYTFYKWGDLLVLITGISGHSAIGRFWLCFRAM